MGLGGEGAWGSLRDPVSEKCHDRSIGLLASKYPDIAAFGQGEFRIIVVVDRGG